VERGFVLITMAVTIAGVLAVAGLAVDLGRIFVAKNEVQTYCDAAALTAASTLDGTIAGINRAANSFFPSPNQWNFGAAGITGATAFATAATGPWLSSPNPATGYAYVQVSASVSVPLYFLSLATGRHSFLVNASAAAGQVPVGSLSRGLAPYTAVSTDTTAPTFGLVVGNSYDIHWPTFNGNRSGCNSNNPSNCFNSTPCSGDPSASMWAVASNWGSQYHGYWGSNSASQIASAVMDNIQLEPISTGENLDPLLTPGNKQSEAGVLDQRVSEDADTTDNTPSSYLANSNHNGRRLFPVVIADPVDSSHTNAIGFGVFLLLSNGSPSDYYKKNGNGNSPYCALYVGPYNIGGAGPGAVAGSTGATWVRLVE
jgi:Putative Flp pilus-assembly TadE/G-like